jgi:hypothetical protein
MGYCGAGGKLIYEKTRSKKSCDTVPFKGAKHEKFATKPLNLEASDAFKAVS